MPKFSFNPVFSDEELGILSRGDKKLEAIANKPLDKTISGSPTLKPLPETIPGDWASYVGNLAESIQPLPRITAPSKTALKTPGFAPILSPMGIMPGMAAWQETPSLEEPREPQGLLKGYAKGLLAGSLKFLPAAYHSAMSAAAKSEAESIRELKRNFPFLKNFPGFDDEAIRTIDELALVHAKNLVEWDKWSVEKFNSNAPNLRQIWDNPNRTWNDAATMIGSGLGQSTPSFLLMMAGGMASYTGNWKQDAAKQLLMSTGVEFPGIYQEIFEKTGQLRPDVALTFSTLAGAVETPFFMSVNKRLARIFGLKVGANIAAKMTADEFPKRVFTEALKDFAAFGAAEGGEEVFQTYLEKKAVEYVDAKFPSLSRENLFEIVQAGLIGAIMGGTTGLATSIYENGGSKDPYSLEKTIKARVVQGYVVAEDEVVDKTGMLPKMLPEPATFKNEPYEGPAWGGTDIPESMPGEFGYQSPEEPPMPAEEPPAPEPPASGEEPTGLSDLVSEPPKTPEKPKTFDQFSKEYRNAFREMMKYSPNEAGSNIWANRMAQLSDEYPDWAKKVEEKIRQIPLLDESGEQGAFEDLMELAKNPQYPLKEKLADYEKVIPGFSERFGKFREQKSWEVLKSKPKEAPNVPVQEVTPEEIPAAKGPTQEETKPEEVKPPEIVPGSVTPPKEKVIPSIEGKRLPLNRVKSLFQKNIIQPIAKSYREGFQKILKKTLTEEQTQELMIEMMQQGRERNEPWLIQDASPSQPEWAIKQAWTIINAGKEVAKPPESVVLPKEEITHQQPPAQTEGGKRFERQNNLYSRLMSLVNKKIPISNSEYQNAMDDLNNQAFSKNAPERAKLPPSDEMLDRVQKIVEKYERVPSPEITPAPISQPAEKPSTENPPAPGHPGRTPSERLANILTKHVQSEKAEPLTWRKLFTYADSVFGGTQAEGKYTVKDAYDAMELAINKLIVENPDLYSPTGTIEEAGGKLAALRAIMEKFPTQTKRTAEQEEFQQFSTPPTLAFVANWLANIQPSDLVLEPSAGTGGLAVFAKATGAKVAVNELSQRRLKLLATLPFDIFTGENAEYINAVKILADVKPTAIVMNPPFSATAGRIQGKRDTAVGMKHIESALAKLQPGGRLVAIVGEGQGISSKKLKPIWDRIRKSYIVLADIGISGEEYRKYGTGFGNRLLVIDKIAPPPSGFQPVTADIERLDELFKYKNLSQTMEVIRNERRTEPTRQEAPGKEMASTPPPVVPTPGTSGELGGRGGKVPVSFQPEGPGSRINPPAIPIQRDDGGRTTSIEPGTPSNFPAGKVTGKSGSSPVTVVGGQTPSGEGLAGKPQQPGDRGEVRRAGGEEGTTTPGGEIPGIKTESTEVEGLPVVSESTFVDYTPARLRVEGAQKHPSKLSETASMASVTPPPVTYSPSLPQKIISEGALSLPQLEFVTYAGQAHEVVFSNGFRQGILNGDGTGVGKGRQLAGVILDNFNKGRKKAVWITKDGQLLKDARRDVTALGFKKDDLFELGSYDKVSKKEGIMFVTYGKLRSVSKPKEGRKQISRVDQIIEWLGKDFDGVIIFDESHLMGNALDNAQKGMAGTKATKTGLAGVSVQNALPNARVVYASATAATEVENLAYATRLGLWGPGTAFPKREDFMSQIGAGGLAAMEIVARDLKSLGKAVSRTLSWDGVTYEEVEHKLTPEQTDVYDRLAKAWQMVSQNVESTLEGTGGKNSGFATAAAHSALWGAQQRFFQQLITGMSLPSAFKNMKEKLDAGESIVVQLVNTNEASFDRQMDKMGEGGEENQIELLDLSPRELLVEYLQNSFPTLLYEETQDQEGNIRWTVVKDAEGNPVQDPQAIKTRDGLIEMIGSLPVPENPLDQIVNFLGSEDVTEVTGRKRRRVMKDGRAILEERTKSTVAAEVQDFEDGKRPSLIFSSAGGTGKTYSSSREFKNQKRRNHYLVQAGWSAPTVTQGFGRSHRTNQANEPNFIPVTTDLSGQKRFTSSIAKRIAQLGAITKGERKSQSSGFYKEFDNLENRYAESAVMQLIDNIDSGNVPWFSPEDIKQKMGLDPNQMSRGKKVEITVTRFLNRLLMLETSLQNRMFNEFFTRMINNIESAKQSGNYDEGLQTIKAIEIKKTGETVLHKTPTGAETKLLTLEVFTKTEKTLLPWTDSLLVVKNKKSGKTWAFHPDYYIDSTKESGAVVKEFRGISPSGTTVWRPMSEIKDAGRFDQAPDKATAQSWWDAEYATTPDTKSETNYLVTGALLPIYDRLPTFPVKVARVQTKTGEYLGRLIPERQLDSVLKNFGISQNEAEGGKKPTEMTPDEVFTAILDENKIVKLSNGWGMRRVKVSGQDRIELEGPGYYQASAVREMGVFPETINYKTRWFIPTDPQTGPATMKLVMENRPAVEVKSPQKAEKAMFSAEYLAAKWASRGLRAAWSWAKGVAGGLKLGEFILKAKKLFPKIANRAIELYRDAVRSLGRRGGFPPIETVGGVMRGFLGLVDKATAPIQHLDFLLRNFPTAEKATRDMYENWNKWEKEKLDRVQAILQGLPQSEYVSVVDILEGKESPEASARAHAAAKQLKSLFREIWDDLEKVTPSLGRVKEYYPHYRTQDTEVEMTPEEQEEFYKKLDELAPTEKKISPDTQFQSTLSRKTEGGWEYSLDIPTVMRSYIKGASKRIFLGPVSDFIRGSEIKEEMRLKKADAVRLSKNPDPRSQEMAQMLRDEIGALGKRLGLLTAAKGITGTEAMEQWRRDLLHSIIMLDYGSFSPIERWLFSTRRDVAIARNRMRMLTGLNARALFLLNYSSALTNLSQQAFIMGDHGYTPYAQAILKTMMRFEGWDEPFKNGAIEDDSLFTQYTGEENQRNTVWQTLWADFIKNPMRGTERINRIIAYHAGVAAFEAEKGRTATREEAKEAGRKSISSSQFDYSKMNRPYVSRTVLSPLMFLLSFPGHVIEKAIRLLGSQGLTGAVKFATRTGIPLALVYVLGRALGYDLEKKLNPVDQPWASPLPLLTGGVINRGLQLADLMTNSKAIKDELRKAQQRAKILSWTEGGEGDLFTTGIGKDIYRLGKEGVTQTLGTAPKGGLARTGKTALSLASKFVPAGLAGAKIARSIDRLAGTGLLGKKEETTVGEEVLRNLGILKTEKADERMTERYKRLFPEGKKPKAPPKTPSAISRKRIERVKKMLRRK